MLTDWLIYLDYLEENNQNTSFLRLITPIIFGIIECNYYDYTKGHGFYFIIYFRYGFGYGDGFGDGNGLGSGSGFGNGSGYGDGYNYSNSYDEEH